MSGRDNPTKEKILHTAIHLFSVNGYAGTSIREIADHAQVNIAAINYHFQSKENLLFEVLKRGFSKLSEDIQKLDPNASLSTEDLCVEIFQCLLRNQDIIKNNMKLVLSEKCQDMDDYGIDDEIYGPPGAWTVKHSFERELKKSISQEDTAWAVQTLFTFMFHQALILSSSLCQRPKTKKLLHPKLIEMRLRRTVRIVLEELRNAKSLS